VDGTVLVTGASSGIGAAIAADLAGRGFTVGCLSRRGTTPKGTGFVALAADVSDHDATRSALEHLCASAGPLCGLVNAAGYHIATPSAHVALAELRAILETNFVAAAGLCQAAYPHLRANGGGLIVNIGSFYERLGVPALLAYSASKAALGSLTRTLAVEWAGDGISVLDVAPGYVHTGLNGGFFADPERRAKVERRIPVGRLGEADEIGRFVGGLFAEPVRFLTGSTLIVDGAQSVAL
jgi:NAD(P)-dependent dehydrogenase (short-subunit alcohol dehydrogenase family)